MNKYLFLVRADAALPNENFRQTVFDRLAPALLRLKPEALKISLTGPDLPALTVLPLRKDNLALISLWLEDDSKAMAELQPLLDKNMTLHGYRVDESVPVACEKTWPDGTPSPGVVLLTLLRQSPKLSYEDFMHEWHGRHTPKAMRIHPFWNYIRNVITETVVDGSPPFQGIVEEHFRTRADCLNPVRMFGGPLKFIPHMIEVGLHAKHFLDLKQTENYLLEETWLRSPA